MKSPDSRAIKVAKWGLIIVVVLFLATRLIRFIVQ